MIYLQRFSKINTHSEIYFLEILMNILFLLNKMQFLPKFTIDSEFISVWRYVILYKSYAY